MPFFQYEDGEQFFSNIIQFDSDDENSFDYFEPEANLNEDLNNDNW